MGVVRAANIAVAVLIAAGLPPAAWAQPGPAGDGGVMPVESRYLGRTVPDVALATTRGRTLLSALARQRPVLLTLVFTRCAGVCSPYLRSLKAADDSIGAGDAYQRVVLSFDSRDTVQDMAGVAAHLGLTERADWTFGVATPADVKQLADAIGFWFTWDPSRQQFDHPALLAGVRQGRVVRLRVGGSVTAASLAEVLREMNGQFVSTYALPGRIRFRCFEYDTATGETRLDWGFALLLIPAVFTTAVTAGIFAVGAARALRKEGLFDAGRTHPAIEHRAGFPESR